MNRTLVRKVSLKDSGDALCPDMTVIERMATLAELNRIGLSATGLADTPLRRDIVRKTSFRSFSGHPAARLV